VSKFSLDVLQQYVFPYVKAEDPDIILGAAFGEDAALTRVGDDILVSHVDPIVGADRRYRLVGSPRGLQ